MNYNQLVNIVGISSSNVNPNGIFVHGRSEDFSLHFADAPIGAGNAAICLFIPYPKVTLDINNSIQLVEYLIGFFKQDSHVSNELQRQQIINDMDILANNFLIDIYTLNQLNIINAVKYPELRLYQGTLSGMMLSMTIKTPTGLCI